MTDTEHRMGSYERESLRDTYLYVTGECFQIGIDIKVSFAKLASKI